MNATANPLQVQLHEQAETICVLQDELARTNQGLVALSMELEQRVEERTAELRATQEELKHTNSELLVLTMELEDRVAQRTEELTQALAALREVEDRTEFALNATQIGTWELNLADGAIQCSGEFDRIFGYDSPPEWNYPVFLDHVHLPDRDAIHEGYQALLRQQQQDWDFECRIRSRDGQIRWIAAHGRLRRNAQEEPGRLVGVMMEITERVQAESKMRKLTQIYATLSCTNETIVRAANVDELYAHLLEAAMTQGQFAWAWIALVDPATQRLEPYVPPGSLEPMAEFRCNIDPALDPHCPAARSIRENQVIVVRDFAVEDDYATSRLAMRRGYRSAAALPFWNGSRMIGALTLFTRETDFFDNDQVHLLQEMSADISFALESFERETHRHQAMHDRGRALEQLKTTLEGSIQAIARIIEARDPYTSGHQQRVGQLARAIATELGLDSALVEGVWFGALIHDIGKIAVPSEILTTPRRLTNLEMELIRTHAQVGYDIIKDIEFPWPVALMVLQHHERLDGSGYPQGLRGEGILLEARIMAVADVVEAMSSHRPYRPGFGIDATLDHVMEFSGKLYDRQVVEACERLFREQGFKLVKAF